MRQGAKKIDAVVAELPWEKLGYQAQVSDRAGGLGRGIFTEKNDMNNNKERKRRK